MTESGKIVTATVLSVLAHVSLFTVLALVPDCALVSATPAEPALDERPLEVTLETATAVPEPAPVFQPTPAPEPATEMPNSKAIRTQIDPENLRKTDEAPENAKAVAAHNSKAADGNPSPTPAPVPSPTPGNADLALAAAKPTPTPGEIGIDALGNYGKAVGNAIGVRWTYHCKHQRPPLPPGEVVRGQFVLDALGRTSEITILSGNANPAITDSARKSVQEAKIPPIPPDRLAQLPGGRMRITFSLSTYSLQ